MGRVDILPYPEPWIRWLACGPAWWRDPPCSTSGESSGFWTAMLLEHGGLALILSQRDTLPSRTLPLSLPSNGYDGANVAVA